MQQTRSLSGNQDGNQYGNQDGNTDTPSGRAVGQAQFSHAQVGLYLGLLTLALAFGSPLGALTGIPLSFLLKDRLHLSPQAMAGFGAIIGIPLYLGFLFGFLRDRWRPFGKGDRGYLILAAPLAVAVYVWLAFGQITYGRLLAGILIGGLLFQISAVATNRDSTRDAAASLLICRPHLEMRHCSSVASVIACTCV